MLWSWQGIVVYVPLDALNVAVDGGKEKQSTRGAGARNLKGRDFV